MPIADVSRVFLATYFIAVGVFYVAKMAGVRQRTGEKSQHYGPVGRAQFWGRAVFEGFRMAILLACILRVIDPQLDAYLGPLTFGQMTPALQALGVGLLLAALALVIYAHSFLGAQWRSGVPTDGPAAFITNGVYARLRHPIFLGVHLGQMGLALAWPSIFTAVCLIVGFVVIQIQARVEEKRMLRAFGRPYAAYRRATPGFVPRLWPVVEQSRAVQLWD
jgi:protein-S-isoprenylcysteine O-methyltransferase Ste14